MSYHRYPPLALNASIADKNVVDQVDFPNGVFIPTGPNLIPRSSAAPLLLVAALAADIKGIQVIADIGLFINIYSDAAGLVKIATMVLTPDETVPLVRPVGSSIYIRHVDDVDIDEPFSHLAMNFLG